MTHWHFGVAFSRWSHRHQMFIVEDRLSLGYARKKDGLAIWQPLPVFTGNIQRCDGECCLVIPPMISREALAQEGSSEFGESGQN